MYVCIHRCASILTVSGVGASAGVCLLPWGSCGVAAVLAVCCVCCGPYRLLCGGGVPCGGKHIDSGILCCLYLHCDGKREQFAPIKGVHVHTTFILLLLIAMTPAYRKLAYTRYSFTCLCVCKKQSSLYYTRPFAVPTLLQYYCATFAQHMTSPRSSLYIQYTIQH